MFNKKNNEKTQHRQYYFEEETPKELVVCLVYGMHPTTSTTITFKNMSEFDDIKDEIIDNIGTDYIIAKEDEVLNLKFFSTAYFSLEDVNNVEENKE